MYIYIVTTSAERWPHAEQCVRVCACESVCEKRNVLSLNETLIFVKLIRKALYIPQCGPFTMSSCEGNSLVCLYCTNTLKVVVATFILFI